MSGKKEVYVNRFLFFIRKRIVFLIPEDSQVFRYLSILGMRISSLKKKRQRDVMKIDIPVVEHCNLCCKGCTAFSPIAEEEYLDYEQYCKDMERLAELTDHNLSQITYTGGEPLLHPKFGEMLRFAYQLFPDAEMSFLTNGVLIPRQTDAFWKTCSECNVKVCISKYPIRLNDKKIEEIKENTRGGGKIRMGWRQRYPYEKIVEISD